MSSDRAAVYASDRSGLPISERGWLLVPRWVSEIAGLSPCCTLASQGSTGDSWLCNHLLNACRLMRFYHVRVPPQPGTAARAFGDSLNE